MKMYLQMGHGMKAMAMELIDDWQDGGVILSPRDLKPSQLCDVSASVNESGGEVLLDPLCYEHSSNHANLQKHDYFRAFLDAPTAAFRGNAMDEVLEELARLDSQLAVRRHILPARIADEANDDWFEFQDATISSARKIWGAETLLPTIALCYESACDEQQVENIVERAAHWSASGVYVVVQGKEKSYLQEHPAWVANLLLLVSGLRLAGKEVIVGYANHQLLCLGAAKANVIASGNFLNVRIFGTDRYFIKEEGATSRRAIWYYCPQAYSEYKIPFLDMAKRSGVIDDIQPSDSRMLLYAAALFTGAMPTAVNWKENKAFCHYLSSLRLQVEDAVHPTYEETLAEYSRSLDEAEALASRLAQKGARAGDRGVDRFLDTNRAALAVFDSARGARLKRAWESLN